jgi:hypothetical protein
MQGSYSSAEDKINSIKDVMLEHTCRHRTKLFVVVRIGTTLTPYTQASVPPFGSGVGGLHSIAGEGVRVPIRTRGQTLWYSRYLCTLCLNRLCC